MAGLRGRSPLAASINGPEGADRLGWGPRAAIAACCPLEDADAWRFWLGRHQAESAGVWLVLAKKGTKEPTRLTYDEALEEALCHGWIDGQLGGELLPGAA